MIVRIEHEFMYIYQPEVLKNRNLVNSRFLIEAKTHLF